MARTLFSRNTNFQFIFIDDFQSICWDLPAIEGLALVTALLRRYLVTPIANLVSTGDGQCYPDLPVSFMIVSDAFPQSCSISWFSLYSHPRALNRPSKLLQTSIVPKSQILCTCAAPATYDFMNNSLWELDPSSVIHIIHRW